MWEDPWPHKPCVRHPHVATKGELPLRLVRRVGEEQPSHPWASEGHQALHFISQGLEGRSHPQLLSPILGNCCDVFLSNAVVTVDRFRVKTQGAEAPGPSGSAARSHVQAVKPVGQVPAAGPQVTGVGGVLLRITPPARPGPQSPAPTYQEARWHLAWPEHRGIGKDVGPRSESSAEGPVHR